MRIAALSDVHGNLPALEAVLAEARRAAVDITVNLGDIVSGPLWPAETADRLMREDLTTIAGNHERQVLAADRERMGASDRHAAERLAARHRDWLGGLPATLRPTGDVLLCHGTPASDLQYGLETVTPQGLRAADADEVHARFGGAAASLVLCGHTHVPRIVQCGATLVVNPGSVGLQAYDDAHPWPHVVEVGCPHARWALLERTAAGWRVELRATPYDHAAAARQAEDHGRVDWADALRTGRMGRRMAA